MSIKKILSLSLAIALCNSLSLAAYVPDAMRGANAIHNNTMLNSSISLTTDPDGNIISFHVNGIDPKDAGILLSQDGAALSTEFTVVRGTCGDGTCCCYMMPSNVATPQVVQGISKELVNAGSINLSITKQETGKS